MDLEVLPILRTLRRNKVGAVLVALQIAVTLAIVSNSLSMIQQRLRWIDRPSGVDESNTFVMTNTWVSDPPDAKVRIETDLSALRGLPGVVDAIATNATPLGGFEWHWSLARSASHEDFVAWTAIYTMDDHGLDAYGLNLIAGRWFKASEIGEIGIRQIKFPASVIVTQSVARALYPAGNALGQELYFEHTGTSRIVGIVQQMQRPSDAPSWGNPWAEFSVLVPYQYVNNGLIYVVRAQPGQQAAVMRDAPIKLKTLTRERIVQNVKSFNELRREAHRGNRATVIMLATLSAMLLAITAFGVVGLTMFWVNQRRPQIGMRRALGARRIDVLRYFHVENLLIAGGGCLLGVVLCLAGNTWLAARLEIARMSLSYACTGAAIVLILCQLAVMWPALRAASVAPAIATRGL